MYPDESNTDTFGATLEMPNRAGFVSPDYHTKEPNLSDAMVLGSNVLNCTPSSHTNCTAILDLSKAYFILYRVEIVPYFAVALNS